MDIIVDRDLCFGSGQCARMAPEMFTLDDDEGLVLLRGTPPADLPEHVRQAVLQCPTGALSLTDAEPGAA